MGRRIRKAVYWQDAPIVREQIVLIPTTLGGTQEGFSRSCESGD